jgi:lysyl-tRNA synthetase class II
MRKTTRSFLQELSDLGLSRDTDLIVESRASNIIQSAVNLLTLIRENYDIETAAELERRFLNSIKTGDAAKFKRGIKRIQESKNDTK